MRERLRLPAVIVATVVVIGLLVVGGLRVRDQLNRNELRDAIDVVPRATVRLAFTDWAAVREEIGVEEDASPSRAELEKLTERGYDRDLTAVSSVDGATAALQEHFGFSPTTMSWEAYAQSRAGAVMVARMPDGFDFDDVRSRLETAGFTEPESDDGVWLGGVDLVASLDPTITPELQYIALLEDEHLIVTSDNVEYAGTAVAVARGKEPSLGDLASARDLVGKAGSPAAAMVWPRDFACTDLSMSLADEDTQRLAEAAIADAGKVTPLAGLVLALMPDRELRAVELFESGDQAADNLSARAKLAVGEAFGRGGSFSDSLDLRTSKTDGSAVVLGWKPKENTGFVLSALDSGPLVFATC